MAAPTTGITWGEVVQGSKETSQGKLGIYKKLSETNTTVTTETQVWFWSKYSVKDTYNTFYSNWDAKSATTSRGAVSISTTSNSGGWSTANQVLLATYTKTYAKGTTEKTGYFAAKLTGLEILGTSKNLTHYISFTIPALAKYTVTYDANGGSDAPDSQTKDYGVDLTLSSAEPTRPGYTFMGWGTSSTDTTVDYSAGASYTSNASITLYAIWKKTITLTYNANGGSGEPAIQSTTIYNATTSYKFTLSSTVPTRTGYTFVGWSTSSSATSAEYSTGGTITLTDSSTLYAIWKKTITLTCDVNGGSGLSSVQVATIYNATTSHTFTLSETEPTRMGYTFLGWSTSKSATTAAYSAGGTITLSGSDILYAVWKINTYTLTINPNDGSGKTQTVTQDYNTTYNVPNPTWEGHTFTGWAISGKGYLDGPTYTFGTGDATLTARWDTNTYNVTFNASMNGGTVSGNEIVVAEYEYGSELNPLPVAIRKNYVFVGWYTDPDEGTQVTESYIVTKNITLYAHFEIDASVYVNADNAWKAGVAFYSDKNGNVKKGYVKRNVNGVWKDGYCT